MYFGVSVSCFALISFNVKEAVTGAKMGPTLTCLPGWLYASVHARSTALQNVMSNHPNTAFPKRASKRKGERKSTLRSRLFPASGTPEKKLVRNGSYVFPPFSPKTEQERVAERYVQGAGVSNGTGFLTVLVCLVRVCECFFSGSSSIETWEYPRMTQARRYTNPCERQAVWERERYREWVRAYVLGVLGDGNASWKTDMFSVESWTSAHGSSGLVHEQRVCCVCVFFFWFSSCLALLCKWRAR